MRREIARPVPPLSERALGAVMTLPTAITAPPFCEDLMSTWPVVAEDLRKALRRSGRSEATVDAMLSELERVHRAMERARGSVDDALLWALVAVQADHYRRAAQTAG
jgi:hypothetical protein